MKEEERYNSWTVCSIINAVFGYDSLNKLTYTVIGGLFKKHFLRVE